MAGCSSLWHTAFCYNGRLLGTTERELARVCHRSHLSSPVLKAALQALYLTNLHLYIPAQLLVFRGEVLEVRCPLISVLRTARAFEYVYRTSKSTSGGKGRGH